MNKKGKGGKKGKGRKEGKEGKEGKKGRKKENQDGIIDTRIEESDVFGYLKVRVGK